MDDKERTGSVLAMLLLVGNGVAVLAVAISYPLPALARAVLFVSALTLTINGIARLFTKIVPNHPTGYTNPLD